MKGNEKGISTPEWREVEQAEDALSCCGGARPKTFSCKVEPKRTKKLSSDQSVRLASLYKEAFDPSFSEVFKPKKPVDSRTMTRAMQTDGEFLETKEEKQVRVKCEMEASNPMGAKRSVQEDVFSDGSILRKELDEKAEAKGGIVKRIISEKNTVLSPEREERESETVVSESEESFTGDLKIMSDSSSDNGTGEMARDSIPMIIIPFEPQANSKQKPTACASKFQREAPRSASSQEVLQKISDFTNVLKKLDLESKQDDENEATEAKKSALVALGKLSDSISQRETQKNNQIQIFKMLCEMQKGLKVSLKEANEQLSEIIDSKKPDPASIQQTQKIRDELEKMLIENGSKLDVALNELGFKSFKDLAAKEDGELLEDHSNLFVFSLGSAMIEQAINSFARPGREEETAIKAFKELQEQNLQRMIERGHKEEEINKRTEAIAAILGVMATPSSAIVESKRK